MKVWNLLVALSRHTPSAPPSSEWHLRSGAETVGPFRDLDDAKSWISHHGGGILTVESGRMTWRLTDYGAPGQLRLFGRAGGIGWYDYPDDRHFSAATR